MSVLGVGHRLDVRVPEGAEDVADADAVGQAWLPARDRSRSRARRGRRTSSGRGARRRAARTERRSVPFASMICGAPGLGDEELDVEEPAVEPERRHEALGDRRELGLALRWEEARVLEALEAVRARVLDRVRDADGRHPAPRASSPRASLRARSGAPRRGTRARSGATRAASAAMSAQRFVYQSVSCRPSRSAASSTRVAFCESRPTTGLAKNGKLEGRYAVQLRERGRGLGRDALLDRAARSACAGRRSSEARRSARAGPSVRRGATRAARSDPSWRRCRPPATASQSSRNADGIEAVEVVEVGPRVADPVPLRESRRVDGAKVPLLRADDENVGHGSAPAGVPEMVPGDGRAVPEQRGAVSR